MITLAKKFDSLTSNCSSFKIPLSLCSNCDFTSASCRRDSSRAPSCVCARAWFIYNIVQETRIYTHNGMMNNKKFQSKYSLRKINKPPLFPSVFFQTFEAFCRNSFPFLSSQQLPGAEAPLHGTSRRYMEMQTSVFRWLKWMHMEYILISSHLFACSLRASKRVIQPLSNSCSLCSYRSWTSFRAVSSALACCAKEETWRLLGLMNGAGLRAERGGGEEEEEGAGGVGCGVAGGGTRSEFLIIFLQAPTKQWLCGFIATGWGERGGVCHEPVSNDQKRWGIL